MDFTSASPMGISEKLQWFADMTFSYNLIQVLAPKDATPVFWVCVLPSIQLPCTNGWEEGQSQTAETWLMALCFDVLHGHTLVQSTRWPSANVQLINEPVTSISTSSTFKQTLGTLILVLGKGYCFDMRRGAGLAVIRSRFNVLLLFKSKKSW